MPPEPKLPTVLRMLLWSQESLAEKNVSFPRVDAEGIATARVDFAPTDLIDAHGGSHPQAHVTNEAATGRGRSGRLVPAEDF